MQNQLTRIEAQLEAVSPRLFGAHKSELERRAGIALLRELARGQPVESSRLAHVLGIPPQEAEAFLKKSCFAPVVHADEQDRVVGFWGLSTIPTRHRLRFGDRTLWAWCALDSLFLPGLLGETAEIESQDPETDDEVQLTVSPDYVEARDLDTLVVSMVRPDTADFTSAARIVATACHFIFFFASRASGERWAANPPVMTLLSLDDAFALGQRQNARVFGLGAGHRVK